MSSSPRAQFRRIAVQVAVLCVIAGCILLGAHHAARTMDGMLDDDAKSTALLWAETLLRNNEALDRALDGESVSVGDQAFFESISHLGNVFRFKIFSSSGALRLVSDTVGSPPRGTLQDHHPEIYDTLLAGGTHVAVFHRTAQVGRPETYAEAYLPIVEDGRVRGIVEVYVDVTRAHALFGEIARRSLWLLTAVGAVAVLHTIGTAALYWRQRRADSQLRHLAHHDPLTGAANRSVFNAKLHQFLVGRRPTDGWVALHIVDIDDFKAVNDTFGHSSGDTLLRMVATRLAECVREEDVVARIGGDEFAVIQRSVASVADARAVAGRMVQKARRIADLDGVPATVSLSVGVALAPEHATLAQDLQHCADTALYRAKSLGRDQFVIFEPGMDEALRKRNLLRVMLRNALDEGTFELHYQPLHCADDGTITGFEALLRMPDGNGGHVPPGVLIPIAEDMGMTPQIGEWVLAEACETAAGWPEHLSVAVNLSPQQFDDDLCAVVERALTRSGLSPQRLELEITESLFISDPQPVEAQLRQIKALGVRVVMDDFGTGYSSLSYLWKFPFDKLKVDRSCFMSLGEASNVAEALRTISLMTGAMQLRVVAEGIETEAQRAFARDAGYDELQGFLYARPMPKGEIDAYLTSATINVEAARCRDASGMARAG